MARSGAWASVKNALRTAGVTTPASSFDEEEERRRREAQTQELYNSYASEVNNAEAFGQAQGSDNASWGGSQSNNMSPWQRAKQSMAAGRYSDIEDPLENLREFANRKAEADRQAAAEAERLNTLHEKYDYHSQGRYTPTEVASGKSDIKALGLTRDQEDMLHEYVNGWGYDVNTGAAATEFLKKSGMEYDTFVKAIDAYRRGNNAKFAESSVLTPSETVEYSQMQINSLSKEERAAFDKIAAGNEYKLGRDDTGKNRAQVGKEMNAANAQIKEGKEELKALGWDDDKIAKYIDYASYISNAKLTDEYNQNFNIDPNASTGEKVKGSIRNTGYDLLMTPIRGFTALADSAVDHPSGLGRDVNGMGSRALNASEYATGQVVNNAITDEHPIAQGAYQIGVSTAEAGEMALISSAIPGGQAITLGAYGTQAYASGYKEAKERGATNEQANMYGIAAGSAEVLTEKLSLDHLWGMAKGTKVGKKLIVDWLAQAGIEASEEMASDLLNRYSDYLILGKNGKNAQTQAIEAYMEQIKAENPNMSEEQVRRQATKQAEFDFWKQVGFDGLAGAVSGGVLGAGGAIAGNINANAQQGAISDYYNSVARDAATDTQYDRDMKAQAEKYAQNPIRLMADTIDDSTEVGRQQKAEVLEYAKKYERDGKLSAQDNFALNRSMEIAEEARTPQEKYEQYLREASQTPSEFRTAATGITVEEGRAQMQDAIRNGDVAGLSAAYNAMKSSTSSEARNNAEEALNEFSAMARANGFTEQDLEGVKTSAQDAYTRALRGESRESLGYLSETSERAFKEGERKRIENNNAVYHTGNEVAVDIVNRSAAAQKTVAAQEGYASNIKEGMNLEQYNYAFNKYYNAGATGIKYENAASNGMGAIVEAALGKETTQAIYDIGRADYEAEVKSKASSSLSSALGVKKGAGTFRDLRSGNTNNIDTNIFDLVAKATGLDIVLTNKGKKGVNGSFNVGKSLITISEDHATALYHELAEFAEVYASDEYDKVRDSVVGATSRVLGSDRYQSAINAYQRVYEQIDADQTVLESSKELTNDMLVALMSTEKGQKALADYMTEKYGAKEAKTLGTKIKDFFKKAIKSIRSLVKNSDMNSYQKQLAESKVDEQEQIFKQFFGALDKAIENYQSTEMTAKAGKEAYSVDVHEAEYLKDSDLSDYIKGGGKFHKNRAIANANGENIIIHSYEELLDKYNKIIDPRTNLDKMSPFAFARIGDQLEKEINNLRPDIKDLDSYFMQIQPKDLRHIYNQHLEAKKPEQGDLPMSRDEILYCVINAKDGNFIGVETVKGGGYKPVLSVKLQDGEVIIVEVASKNDMALSLKTMWKFKDEASLNKYLDSLKGLIRKGTMDSSESLRSGTDHSHSTSSDLKVSQKGENSNKGNIKFSLPVAEEDNRVFYVRNTEVVQNPTSKEYEQMREAIYKDRPWLRGTGEAILRHTYDEQGNEYYWDAMGGMHSQIEPYINERFNTRTSQQWEWWKREDKDDYPVNYKRGADIRYSLGGIYAQGVDDASYRKAYALERAGKSAEDIYKETGWYRGADGKYRFEISNKDSKVFIDGLAKVSDSEEYKRFTELNNKLNNSKNYENSEQFADDWMEYSDLYDKLKGEANKEEYRLDDILKHDELYNYYPSLARIKVTFGELEPGVRGSYNQKSNTITLSDTLRNSYVAQTTLRKTLLHEVQHAIQSIEGFARGSSDEEWRGRRLPRIISEEAQQAYDEALSKLSEVEERAPKDYLNRYNEYMVQMGNYGGLQDNEDWYESAQKIAEDLRREDATLFEELEEAFWDADVLKPEGEELLPLDAYHATAGEIEAREVADRLDMTDEERRAKMPNIKDEKGRVVFAEERYSLDIGDVEKQAKEHFGTTDSFRTAGYMLPNGELLDFSGAHWLKESGESDEYIAKWKKDNDIRQVDHEDIYEVLEASGDNRKQFMERGNIRLSPEAPGINLLTSVEPTAAQYRELKEFIREIKKDPYYDDTRFYVDLEDTHPNKISYGGNLNEDRIINDIKNFYATGQMPQPSVNDFRYSMEIDDLWEEVFNEQYGDTASILEEGMEALKGQEVDRKKVDKIAIALKKEYGSTINTKMFADMMEKAFAYMQTGEHVNYNDMMRVMDEIARPVIEEATTAKSEDYDKFVAALKGYKIKLNDKQMAEVRNAYDSYASFKKAAAPINFNKNGTYLDSLWEEIVASTDGLLDGDITDANEPLALLDVLESLRPSPVNNFEGNTEDVTRDLALRIVEEYLDVQAQEEGDAKYNKLKAKQSGIRQEARQKYTDKLKKAKADMKAKRLDYQKQVRDRYNQRLADQKAKLKEQLKQGKLDARLAVLTERYKSLDKLAEIRAKNRERAQNAREIRTQRELKEKISNRARKLATWIMSPTEQHHIPTDMMEPVLEFLNALDFVEPEVKVNKKGLYYVRVFNHSVLDASGKRQMVFDTIEGESRDDVIRRYYLALGAGTGSQATRSWIDRMSELQDVLSRVRDGSTFEHRDMDAFMQTIDPTLADSLGDVIKRNRGLLTVNNLKSSDLATINNALRNIMHAISQGNKAFSINEEIDKLGDDTIGLAKEIGKDKVHGSLYNKLTQTLRLDMATPETYFSLLGEGGKKIYKALRQGFNTKVRDIRKAQGFMEETMKGIKKKDLDKWTGRKADVHTFNVTDGQINLTTAQIMSLYELNKRQQATLHFKGGIEADIINRAKGGVLNQSSEPVHLSDSELENILNTLTDEQKAIADKLQQYMALECSKDGNEASMTMYGFEKFVDENYFPISTDKSYITANNSNTSRDSLNGIERSGFTKQLIQNASNPIIIKDIFDVFTDHVADMATYHGFAPAMKDANRWFNYKTVDQVDENIGRWDSVQKAIQRISGEGGSRYYVKLMQDLNGSEKSQYIGNFTDSLISNYKAAAVGANIRVIIQQPTAYFRAMNVLSPKYLMNAVLSPVQAHKIGNQMREESEIAWWKSQGYFETSIGKSMKEIITGQSSIMEEARNKSMALAGWADDVTWGVLYTAVTKEQQALAKKEGGVSKEDLTQRIKDRFDEVVDQTQVVDSTLHRSQYMRSKDTLNKLQTAFMAEPTKSYNMLMKAILEDMREGKGFKKAGKAAMVFAITNIITSAAAAVIDAFRRDTDDEDWGEVYLNALRDNVIDNVNPLNLIPVLKDASNTLINTIMGETTFNTSSNRMDMDAITSLVSSAQAIVKYASGDSNKTKYGMYMTLARPISQITGVPLYNLSRDLSALYNAFMPDLQKTISSNKYTSIYDAIKQDKSVEDISAIVQGVLENDGTIYDIKSGITSRYKSDYYDLYAAGEDGDEEAAQKAHDLAEKATKGLLAIGMTEEEAEDTILEWQDPTYGYSVLDKAIESGEGIEDAVKFLQEAKDNDKMIKHVVDHYGSTIRYNRDNEIDSSIEDNVNKALDSIEKGTTYDKAAKALADKEAATAAKTKLQQEKAALRDATYKILETGQGDYKQAINNWASKLMEGKSGDEAIKDAGSTMKSSLTTDYTKPLVKAYKNGDSSAQQKLTRVAMIKAYIDEQTGTTIAKKYGGDYYQYEMDQIIELLNKYDVEPW